MSKKVFVSGCFDIIHGGHVEFFNQAKEFGGPNSKLIVSFASDEVLLKYKDRKSSLPQEHKKRLLESMAVIDEVVIGTNVNQEGIDFLSHFDRIKPDYLVVTEDDKYESVKRELCWKYNCEYVVLPKTLHFEKISTTDVVNWIKAPKEVPLRVDFVGGWLDVPKYSGKGYIINCTITPTVSLKEWPYKIKSGLGGSAAYSILTGKNAIESELEMGVGWQDPAIINETGFCIWKSGRKPKLIVKRNPVFLEGVMALLWTGNEHDTPNNVDRKRNYKEIIEASECGRTILDLPSRYFHEKVADVVELSYEIQLEEGMKPLKKYSARGRKYCGGGWGGYALYIFDGKRTRDYFCEVHDDAIAIEPYMK